MIPPDDQAKSMRESQKQFGQSIFDAIKNSGCKKVVNLSSVGAESDRPTGPVKGLYDQEVRLSNHKEVDIIHLRPTYFLENFFGVLELIKTKGILGSAINADAPFYTIATKDIAQRAAKLMMNPKFKGHTHLYLLGVKRTTLKEIAQAFSKALGKKLKYIHFGYDETKAAMMGMGFSEDAANNMVELSKAVNDGILFEQIDKNHDSFTKTTPEEFAKIYFKPLF
jgi:uncharacterized protein YbjT (DUF2867 family)